MQLADLLELLGCMRNKTQLEDCRRDRKFLLFPTLVCLYVRLVCVTTAGCRLLVRRQRHIVRCMNPFIIKMVRNDVPYNSHKITEIRKKP